MNSCFLAARTTPVALVALLVLSCGSSRAEEKYGEDFPWLWTVGLKPTERAAFEVESKNGAVLVSYEPGGGLEIMPGCGKLGEYEFQEATKTAQKEIINSERQIFAKFPLKAEKLAGGYSQGDKWTLEYVIVGMRTVSITEEDLEELEDRCERATHYVRSMAVGAYVLTTDAEQERVEKRGEGGMDAGPAAIIEKRDKAIEIGGDFSACTGDEVMAGDPACHAIIRLYLEPL